MNNEKKHMEDTVLIGGGVIGLATGWQLLRRGFRVTILERESAETSAGWFAAGMLAPHAEAGFEELGALQLGLKSLEMYPGFLNQLREDSGHDVRLDSRGAMMIGFGRDDEERLRRLYDFRRQLDLHVEWLTASEAIDREPLLSPKVTCAIWLPGDSQVNSRSLIRALVDAVRARGGILLENTPVTSLVVDGGRVSSVVTADTRIDASNVVLAAGCWSNQIEGLPHSEQPPVRPVKGQIVSLLMDKDFVPSHVIRAPDVYLLPKDDGRLLVGATQEEMGFDTTPTAGPVMRLLERAWEAMPCIYDLPIESIDVGLRPGSRDHNPIIGRGNLENLYHASGHYRSGILLAPVTAFGIVEMVAGGTVPDELEPFGPSRFAPSPNVAGGGR